MMSRYPWQDWLDGRVWYVRYGDDFSCMNVSIQGQAHAWAAKLGTAVATRDVSRGVLIQAYPLGSTWKPNLSVISKTKVRKHLDNVR